jgi:hypothetical protein
MQKIAPLFAALRSITIVAPMSTSPVAVLSPDARLAVAAARARPLSYRMRLLVAPDRRPVVVLGEVHLKLPRAQRIGRQLVDAFDLRGVETFPRGRVFLGRVLGVLLVAPRLLLRALTLGFVRGSTITDARRAPRGHTGLLENVSPIPLSLHVASAYLSAYFAVTFALLGLRPVFDHLPVPFVSLCQLVALAFAWHMPLLIPALLLRRHAWSWILYPPIAILTVRDRTLAEGTAALLRDHPLPPAVLVIMGRAHLPGYVRVLVERYGFVEAELE